MFGILHARRSYERPQGPFVLNEDSPQAQGLVAWYPLGDELFAKNYSNRRGRFHIDTLIGDTEFPSLLNSEGVLCHQFTSTGTLDGGLAAADPCVTAFPLTMTAWAHPSAINAVQPFCSICTNGSDNYWQMRMTSSGLVEARSRAGGTGSGSTSATALRAIEWNHVASRFESATSRYSAANGIWGAQSTTSRNPSGFTHTAIGCGYGTDNVSNSLARTRLADVRFYSRILVDELAAHIDPGSRYDLYYYLGRKLYSFPVAAAINVTPSPLTVQATIVAPAVTVGTLISLSPLTVQVTIPTHQIAGASNLELSPLTVQATVIAPVVTSQAVPETVTGLVTWIDANHIASLESDSGLTEYILDRYGGLDPVCPKQIGLVASPLLSGIRMFRIGGDNSSRGGFFYWDDATVPAVFQGQNTVFFSGCFPTHHANNANGPALFSASNTGDNDQVLRVSQINGKYVVFYRDDTSSTSATATSTLDVSSEHAVYCLRRNSTTVELLRKQHGDTGWTTLCSASYSGSAVMTFNRFTVGGLQRITTSNSGEVIGTDVLVYDNYVSDANRDLIGDFLLNTRYGAVANEFRNTMPQVYELFQKPKLIRITKTAGVYGHTFSDEFALYAGASGIYYVSPFGDDAGGDGSPGDPWRHLTKACNAADINMILGEPGFYNLSTLTKVNRSVIIACLTGRMYVGKWDPTPTAWTKTTGRTNVYEFTKVGTFAEVLDATNLNSDGKPQPMTAVASVAACDALANSYFNDITILYVHLHDSRQADEMVGVRVGTCDMDLPFNTTTGEGGFLRAINQDFYRLNSHEVDGAGCHFEWFDCHFWDSQGDISWANAISSYLIECIADSGGHATDIFDSRNDCVLVGVWLVARNPGVADSSNCWTLHDSAVGLLLEPELDGGYRNLHNIGTSRDWVINPITKNALTGGPNTGISIITGSIGSAEVTELQLEGGDFQNNAIDIVAAGASVIWAMGLSQFDTTWDELDTGQIIWENTDIFLSALSAQSALVAPLVTAETAINVSPLSVQATIIAPVVTAQLRVALEPLITQATIVAPTVSWGNEISLSPLAVNTTIGDVFVGAVTLVQLEEMPVSATIVTPSITVGTTISLEPLQVTGALVTPNVSAVTQATLTPLQAQVSIIAPTIVVGNTIHLSPFAVQVTLVAPSVSVGAISVSFSPLQVRATVLTHVVSSEITFGTILFDGIEVVAQPDVDSVDVTSVDMFDDIEVDP